MRLFNELHRKGIWRGYHRHVVMLNPVLEAASARGIPIDPHTYSAVHKRLTDDLAATKAAMQALIPFEVVAKKFYKREPKKKGPDTLCIDGKWLRLLPWTPSSKALIRYMNHRGHPVPKAIKSDKDTTNQLELERLAKRTGDPVYFKVLEYRKAQTVLKNHMANWAPGPDNRVHPTFYFDPATGQLSSRRPNSQNAPNHTGEYAKLFRSMVAAPEGYTIMEFDYKSFHVQTLGFEARDLDLMRMGRLDIHSFVTAHFLRLPEADKLYSMDDGELGEFLGWVKKNHKHTRDAKAKHALLGYNNGMGYKKLYLQYQEYFENMKEAQQLLKLFDTLFPAAKVFRDNICQQAHEQGYLISRHGYIRYFWEVFRWKNGGWSKDGDDHEKALCFFTQNDAHGELKDRILTLAERGLDERYWFINTIHDSIMFCCPTPLVDEAREVVYNIMVSPSTVLVDPISAPNGLSVDVEVKAGPHWAAMKGI